MTIRINVEDNADLELSDIDVTVVGDCIQFSIEGTISEVPTDILDEHTGDRLSPVEIIFEEK